MHQYAKSLFPIGKRLPFQPPDTCACVISSGALAQEEVEAAYSPEGVGAYNRVPVHIPVEEAVEAYNQAVASFHLPVAQLPHRCHLAEVLPVPALHTLEAEAVEACSPEAAVACPAPDHRPKVAEEVDSSHHHRRQTSPPSSTWASIPASHCRRHRPSRSNRHWRKTRPWPSAHLPSGHAIFHSVSSCGPRCVLMCVIQWVTPLHFSGSTCPASNSPYNPRALRKLYSEISVHLPTCCKKAFCDAHTLPASLSRAATSSMTSMVIFLRALSTVSGKRRSCT